MTPLMLLASLGGAFLLVSMLFFANGKDYRKRGFYRKFYTPNAFNLILFGWRILGETGSWVITRIIGLGSVSYTHLDVYKRQASQIPVSPAS